jgi:hypothetical protein
VHAPWQQNASAKTNTPADGATRHSAAAVGGERLFVALRERLFVALRKEKEQGYT